jgi:hypothetical protein
MLDPGDIAAVIPTRGNHPEGLEEIIASLPYDEIVIWDNSKRRNDVGVMGRYAAIAETTKPFIFTQDDDVVVLKHELLWERYETDCVAGIMPTDLLPEHCLLGYGSVFHRDLPGQYFGQWLRQGGSIRDLVAGHCDMIFGTLAPKIRIECGAETPWHATKYQTVQEARDADVSPVKMMPYHFWDVDPDRMHHQEGHDERRHRIYDDCFTILTGSKIVCRVPTLDYGDHDRRR